MDNHDNPKLHELLMALAEATAAHVIKYPKVVDHELSPMLESAPPADHPRH